MARWAFLFLALLLPFPLAAEAAPVSIDGDWLGTILVGPAKLRVDFHVETKADRTTAELISIDQGNVHIPIASVTRDGDKVMLAVPAARGEYSGVLAPGAKTMTGTWTQAGQAMPLSLALGALRPLGVAEDDQSLTLGSDTLVGTLAYPGTSAAPPAVLMIAGSGPTDRNGSSPTLGSLADSQRLLAYGLAQDGIASLRTDKRGVGGSAGALHGENSLRIDILAHDTKAWAKLLMNRTGAKCVWLAGHSEGSLIAELAAQDNPDICGLVLLAGPGRHLADVLRTQLARLPDDRRKSADEAIDALAAGHTIDRPADDRLFRPSIQPLWISEFALDPPALLKRLSIPVLIVQGDADNRIEMEDARLLAAARPDAKLLIVPGMAHELKLMPSGGQAAIGSDPTIPLAPGVVETIAAFIKAH